MSTLKLQCLSSTGSQIFAINEVSGVISTTIVNFNNTTNSINSSTGSLVINGGLGIIKDVYVGSSVVTPNINTINVTASNLNSINLTSNNLISSNLLSNNISNSNLISTNISSGILNVNAINVSGNVTIGGNLVVVGSTTIVNITTSNQLESNVTAASILITGGSLNATFNTNTLGNLFTTGGNIGINNTSPNYQLDLSGNSRFSGNLNLGSNIYGNFNTSTGNIYSNYLGYNYASGILCNGGNFVSPYFMTTQYVNSLDTVYLYTPGANNTSVKISMLHNGNIGINTTSPQFTLDVNGISRISGSLTTGNIYSTNSTITNIVITNFTTSNSNVTNSSIASLNSVNVSTTNFTTSNSNVTNSSIASLNSINISTTNFTTNNSNVTNSSIASLNSVNVSTTNFTTSNSNVTNSSIASLSSTFANIKNLLSTTISTGTLISNNITTNSIFITGGSLNATFTTNTLANLFTIGGNIGINVVNPSNLLEVFNGRITVRSNNISSVIQSLFESTTITQGTFLFTQNDNKSYLYNASIAGGANNSLILQATATNAQLGNVGIGTNTPNYTLDINGSIGISGSSINLNNATSNTILYNTSGVQAPTFGTRSIGTKIVLYPNIASNQLDYAIGIENVSVWFSTLQNFKWYANSTTPSMVINGTNVGIGTTSPSNQLDVRSTSSDAIINLQSTNSQIRLYSTNASNIQYIQSSGDINFSAIGSTSVRTLYLATSGNVGIGTNTPLFPLDVNGLIRSIITIPSIGQNDLIHFGQSESNNNMAIIDYNFVTVGSSLNSIGLGFYGANNKLVVTASGNVGINTSSPIFNLDVNASSRITSSLAVGNLISSVQSRPLTVSNTNVSFGSISVTNNNGGDARYHLYNGGANSEWVFGQKTSVRNDFSITGLNSGTERDLLTINSAFAGGTGFVGINNSAPTYQLDVNGTLRVTLSITTGSIYSTNSTTTNLVSTNSSISNIILNNSTISNIITSFITAGSILTNNISSLNDTIGNLNSTNTSITNLNTTNITSGIINVTGITSSNINFTGNLYKNGNLYISSQWTSFGTNLTYTSGNVGINTTSPNYILDVNGITRINNTSFSTNNTLGALIVSGGISVTSTNSSSNSVGGGLTVSGGAAISQDVYIGGNLYVQGINNSVLSGSKLLSSNSSSGILQVTVNTTRTFSNNTYKIVGNTSTISSNTAMFAVSFISLTTSSFVANIYRVDALGGPWALTDLTLNYSIYP